MRLCYRAALQARGQWMPTFEQHFFNLLKRETLPPIAWDRTRLGEAQGGSYWSGFEESLAERWVGKRAQDALHR